MKPTFKNEGTERSWTVGTNYKLFVCRYPILLPQKTLALMILDLRPYLFLPMMVLVFEIP